MPEYLRVKDNETGHEFSVPARRFDADAMTEVDKPALTAGGEIARPKFHTTVAKAAAKKTPAAPVAMEKKAAESADQSDNNASSKEH